MSRDGLREAIESLPEMVGEPNEGGWSLVRRSDVLAALAAAPTQSGAEGPALADDIERAADGYLSAISAVATARFREDVARLRSGAEVAAAPGLSEAWDEDEAADWARADRRPGDGIHLHATDSYCADVRGLREDGIKVIYEETGPTPAAALLALAARLTAKP